MSRIARWTLTLIVALLAVGASCGGAAAAAPRTPDSRPNDNARLERMYKAEQSRLKEMERRLHLADKYAGQVEALIARIKNRGLDTTPLVRSLATFRDHMAGARHQWEAARDTLVTHAGFDAQGHVTDAGLAGATLRDAHGHMERAHAIARAAYGELHAAIVVYLRTHRGVPEPPAPLAP